MDRSSIAIVIPALNEERTIASVIANAIPYGQVIVVDDGSSDRTGTLARNAGAEVVRHERNKGYDAALNSGFAQASLRGYSVIITLDADGQHDPSLVRQFVDAVEGGADVVLGVRDKFQRLSEKIFSWVARFKFRIRDPLCGMKAYRMAVYQRCGHFDSYGSIGTELAIFSVQNGFSVAEVFVRTRPRLDQPRFGRRFAANAKILRALWLGLRIPKRRGADR